MTTGVAIGLRSYKPSFIASQQTISLPKGSNCESTSLSEGTSLSPPVLQRAGDLHIIDCFIFNTELDILEFRLKVFDGKIIDGIIIIIYLLLYNLVDTDSGRGFFCLGRSNHDIFWQQQKSALRVQFATFQTLPRQDPTCGNRGQPNPSQRMGKRGISTKLIKARPRDIRYSTFTSRFDHWVGRGRSARSKVRA